MRYVVIGAIPNMGGVVVIIHTAFQMHCGKGQQPTAFGLLSCMVHKKVVPSTVTVDDVEGIRSVLANI